MKVIEIEPNWDTLNRENASLGIPIMFKIHRIVSNTKEYAGTVTSGHLSLSRVSHRAFCRIFISENILSPLTNLPGLHMMKLFTLPLLLPLAASTKVIDFSSADAKGADNLIGLNLQSRIIVPYGPDIYSENPTQTEEDRPYRGYGYGMVRL